MVQAAGDHRSVAQNRRLFPEAKAETGSALRSAQVRPLELFRLLQIQPFSQPPAAPPGLGQLQGMNAQLPGQKGENFFIPHLPASQVPQSQRTDHPSAGGPPGEFPGGEEIAGQIPHAVPLGAVEGNADLVKSGGGEEEGGAVRQQRSVGGKAHPEAFFLRDAEQLLQLRMQKRLAHHMKIQV